MLNQHQQINEQIKKAKNILITFNKDWGGDSVASALSVYLFLKRIGKNVDLAAEKAEKNKSLSFLPAYADIQNSLSNLRKFIISLDISNAKVGQVKYESEANKLNFIISPKEGFFSSENISSKAGDFKYDLVIVLNSPDLESLGRIYDNDTEFFYQIPIINIDHHSSNEEYGQMNLIELTAVSTSEIIFNFIAEYSRDIIDEDIATCLLAGMIAETRSFKTQNITPQALTVASQLISMGARREEIVNQLYRSRPLSVLKIWGRVLARLSSALEGKLVWSVLTNMDFEKTGARIEDLPEVIDELIINIPDSKVIIVIHEFSATETKAIIYSMKNINSLHMAKEWNPLGTKNYAEITLNKPLQEAEMEIVETIKTKLSELPL